MCVRRFLFDQIGNDSGANQKKKIVSARVGVRMKSTRKVVQMKSTRKVIQMKSSKHMASVNYSMVDNKADKYR